MHTPVVTGSDAEGAGELFKLQSGKEDFFGKLGILRGFFYGPEGQKFFLLFLAFLETKWGKIEIFLQKLKNFS